MTPPTPRPSVTTELVRQACRTLVEANNWPSSGPDDIASVFRPGMDGYQIARELEGTCGWYITAVDVEELDHVPIKVDTLLRQAQHAWATEHSIQPPFPIGTLLTRGEITGISSFAAASYEVRDPNDTIPSRRYIIPFEQARVAHTGCA